MFGEVAVPVEVPAVQRDLTDRVRGVADHLQQVGQDRDPVVAVVEDLQRLVEDRLLPIRGGLGADDLQQGTDHGVAAAVGLGQHLIPKGSGQPGRGRGRIPRVQHVQRSAAPPEGDDLATQCLDEVDVVRLQIPQHDRHRPEAG